MARDAVETMGNLLPDDAGGRDAVHVAVFSATCEKYLLAGQALALVSAGDPDCVVKGSPGHAETVAIVDPFLEDGMVPPGRRFWAYLLPRKITALSHRWSHPAFGEHAGGYNTPGQLLRSEKWLRDFCEMGDCPSYDRMVEISNKIADGEMRDGDSSWGWSLDDEYLLIRGADAHIAIPQEFWEHMDVVIGRPVFTIGRRRPDHFTCSC